MQPNLQPQSYPGYAYGFPQHPQQSTPATAAVSPNSEQTVATQAKQRKKRCDWSSREIVILCQIWPPRYGDLKKGSTKNKSLIWDEIYSKFLSELETDTDKDLEQLKTKTRSLQKEFKDLKARMDRTGEEGALKIKEKMISTFDLLDEYLSERDSIDPAKMKILTSGLTQNEQAEQVPIQPQSDERDPAEQNPAEQNDTTGKAEACSSKQKVSKKKEGKKRKNTEDVYDLLKFSVDNQAKNNEIMKTAAKELKEGMVEQANVLVTGFKDVMKTLVENKK